MKKIIIIFSFMFLLFSCGNKKVDSGFSSSLDSSITSTFSSEDSSITEESLLSEESLSSESESSSSEESSVNETDSGDIIDGDQLQTSWNW